MILRKRLFNFICLILTSLIILNPSTVSYAQESVKTKVDINIQADLESIMIKEKWRLGLSGDKSFDRNLNVNVDEITNFNAELVFPEKQNLEYSISEHGDISIKTPANLNQEIILEVSYSLNDKFKKNSFVSNIENILFSEESSKNVSLLNLHIRDTNDVHLEKEYRDITLDDVCSTSKNTNTINKTTKDTKEDKAMKSNTSDKNLIKDLISFILEFILISVVSIISLGLCLLGIEFYKHKKKQNNRVFKSRKKKFKK